MTQPRNKELQQAVTDLTTFIGSTRQMMEKLFRADHKVHDNVSSNSRRLKQLITLEAETAQLYSSAQNYPSRLLPTTTSIRSNIEHLAENSKSSAASQMKQYLSGNFLPLQSDATDRTKQREQLIHSIKEFIQDKNVTMEQIVQAMNKGTITEDVVKKTLDKAAKKLDKLATGEKTEDQIVESLNKLMKRLNELQNTNTKLVVNEESLQKKLDNLDNESLKAAQTTGVALQKEPGQKPGIPKAGN